MSCAHADIVVIVVIGIEIDVDVVVCAVSTSARQRSRAHLVLSNIVTQHSDETPPTQITVVIGGGKVTCGE